MPQNTSKTSCFQTLLWLDDQKYKRRTASTNFSYLLSISRSTLERTSTLLLSVHLLSTMSCPSTPIYVSSRDSTPSPSSSSDSENAAMNRQIRSHRAQGCMTMTTNVLTIAQICHNTMEEAREYQDEWIDELSDEAGATYSRTFMHAAMISH